MPESPSAQWVRADHSLGDLRKRFVVHQQASAEPVGAERLLDTPPLRKQDKAFGEVRTANDLAAMCRLASATSVDFPPGSGGVRSEDHAAARMVLASMLARASAGVR